MGDALVDALYLVGPKERIRDRLAVWRASGVDLLMVGAFDQEALRLVAEANNSENRNCARSAAVGR